MKKPKNHSINQKFTHITPENRAIIKYLYIIVLNKIQALNLLQFGSPKGKFSNGRKIHATLRKALEVQRFFFSGNMIPLSFLRCFL
ncbi:MAG: hypothetical protein KBG19_00565 [Bacteroidales bacterium]|jgi:hypothetical protein|nr:hypothetical protein [Bacteroidales bacterium]